MATSQHAFKPSVNAHHYSPESESLTIDLEHVGVSQLLGRDYVFINNQTSELAINNSSTFQNQLNNLIRQLELSETHTVMVSVIEAKDAEVSFTRHDLTWYRHKICRIESLPITEQEQHEFMDMIWRCSTTAAIFA